MRIYFTINATPEYNSLTTAEKTELLAVMRTSLTSRIVYFALAIFYIVSRLANFKIGGEWGIHSVTGLILFVTYFGSIYYWRSYIKKKWL